MTASAGQALLQGIDVSWAVGDRFVLLDVQIALRPGSVAVLTGPNGAGKSTLLDLLAGVRAPTRGRVELGGVPLPEVDPGHLAQRVARLGHKPGLYLDLTATENLRLFTELTLGPLTDAEAGQRLEIVGIGARDQHRPVRHFSRGMLQRVALARILASGADVWLLDEPSTGLDVAGCRWLADTLDLARARGVAALLATHDEMFLAHADRHLQLRHGRLEEAAA